MPDSHVCSICGGNRVIDANIEQREDSNVCVPQAGKSNAEG